MDHAQDDGFVELDDALPQIAALGPMAFDPIWAMETHVNRRAEAMYVLSGELSLIAGDTRLAAGPGEAVLVPAGTEHRDEFDLREGLEVFYCAFDWAHADEYFRRVPPAAMAGLSPACRAEVSTAFGRLRADLRGGEPESQLVARCRLLTLLLLILRDVAAPERAGEADYGRTRSVSLMERARRFMQEHYAEPLSLDDIASALHVSGYHLSHVFSRESNFTLFSYLTSLRMERARSLLTRGDRNVSEVARAVGYRDANYFSKAFRKHWGCSPTEFVARHLAGR